ncbi:MAG: hypothetical protein J7501_17110, partial [Bdellovibrio sp.]|nr:hypothetical protein [Bdellovibrio sp.]
MAENSDNATLVLDIVFDDGSVQKGFVKLESLSKTTSKKIKDDHKDLKLIDFEKLREEGTSAFTELGGGLVKFGFAAAAVGIVLGSIKEALNLAQEGEHIRAINSQFEVLTRQAGIATHELQEGLERAADGLIGLDDLLKVANQSIINLGSSAARLPELLDLTRKVTAVMGGDLEDRFQAISQAIENGSQKGLKAQGIILDVDKAYRDYANTLLLTTSELNTSQKQQALLNAVLEQGGERYKNIDATVQPMTDNIKRAAVAWKELKDELAIGVSGWEWIGNVAEALRDFGKIPSQQEENKSIFGLQRVMADRLKSSIEELQKKGSDLRGSLFFEESTNGSSSKISQLRDEIADIDTKLPQMQKQLDEY